MSRVSKHACDYAIYAISPNPHDNIAQDPSVGHFGAPTQQETGGSVFRRVEDGQIMMIIVTATILRIFEPSIETG